MAQPGTSLRDAGRPADAESAGWLIAGARRWWPLAAPFLILTCAPRWELAAAAACWSVMLLPGLLAVDLFFPPDHPWGRGFGRVATASVGGLLVFGLVSWIGRLWHTTLTTVLVLYAVLYVVCVAVLLRVWVHRRPRVRQPDEPWPNLEVALTTPRWMAALVLLGIAVLMVGVVLATAQSGDPRSTPGFWNARPYWWQGTLLGALGSVLAAAFVLLAVRRRPQAGQNARPVSRNRRDKTKPGSTPAVPLSPAWASGSWLVLFLWLGVAGLTWQTMRVAYTLPAENRPAHMYRPLWNSDDVTYVSQAVDARYGLPLGKYESSTGSNVPLNRTDLAPLIEPLMAAMSRVTGIECAALQHSVMLPLVVLTGVSAWTALLMVVFRAHRWAVPLGLLVVLMVLGKSWEYERSMVEFMVWRAMQTKSIHLWLLYPLQMASLVLLASRPNKRHLLAGLAIASAAHLVHPFATILGAVWTAVLCVMVIGRRQTWPKVLILLACYGALGAEQYALSRVSGPETPLSTGRTEGEPEQSRDMVRVNDQPIPRHDPRILFGWDTVFNLGALAIPLVLAMGRRHRELLLPALIGVVVVACCNSVFLGGLINRALPTAILWRFRWGQPSLLHVAVIAFGLYWAFSVLLSRRDRTTTPTRSFLASIAAVALFAAMLANTSGYAMRAGPPPKRLTKFSNDLHGLVDLLGGVEAAPFVWGPRTVTEELPQLMPSVRLVLSREKIMLPADDPQFRGVVLQTRNLFYAPPESYPDKLSPQDGYLLAALDRLTRLYPIDHFVLDYQSRRGEQGARVLQQAGWQKVGRSGTYEVWRHPPPS